MALFGRTVIVCHKAVDLLTDYLEDALPVRGQARLEAHLAGCLSPASGMGPVVRHDLGTT